MPRRRNPNFGKKHSDETKLKISAALKGERNPNFGKKHSDESKLILRAYGGPSYTSYCLSAAFGGALLDDSPLNTLEAINGSTVQAELEPRSSPRRVV